MAKITLACPFCGTLNRVELERASQGPKCAECQKPFRLDRPFKVHEEHFDTTVLQSEAPVVVDFYADWCGPCVTMAPVVDELAGELMGKALIAKVDTDAAPSISQRYNIRSIPFFARFEHGEMVESAVGAVGREALRKLAVEKAGGAGTGR